MMKKTAVSLLACVAMLFTSVFTMPVYAAENASAGSDSLTATKGVYWFDPHLTGTDLTDNYIYDDELLKGDSLEFNWSLASMTYELAVMSISSEREPRTEEGYKNKSRNVKAYLEDNGFVDFDTNEDYTKRMTTRTMGVACAHKKITDGGKEYTVLAIVPRSAGYESEWGGNFILGAEGDHEGFKLGKDKVLAFAKEYVEKYGIKGDIKVWTAGYSRGAGVTNQVGAALIRDPKSALGDAVTLTPENLYCYTYGTPNSASTDSDYKDSKYDHIHNLFQPYDITTVVPFEILGFTRYGKNFTYAEADKKERMLSLLKDLNKDVYDAYTTVGDPVKFFKPKKIDIDALAKGQLNFVDDNDSYLPADQEQFAKLLANTAGAAFKTRKEFVDKTQDGVEALGGYYFSHLDKADALVEGAKESKYAIPAVISLYIAYMADRYREHEITAEERAELNKWINEFEEYINKAISDGEKVPQDIIDKMIELKDQIKNMVKLDVIADAASALNALMVQQTLMAALTNAGLPEEDKDLYDKITDIKSCQGMAHAAAYFMLYDELQEKAKPEKLITFDYLSKQFKHLATLVGNAGSYQRPHNNEVILSWLRTQDSAYDDFAKETAAQIAGYRRVYIEGADDAVVRGTVLDESGNEVATFEDGKILSRTDKWIGITTCDNGNWLRLPLDKTYRIVLHTDKKAKMNIKVTEYEVYDAKEVRTETKDDKYNWQGIAPDDDSHIVLHVEKVEAVDNAYALPSKAKYYIEMEAHKWDAGKVTKEATVDAEGEKTYTCEICGETKTEPIPKLDPDKKDDKKDDPSSDPDEKKDPAYEEGCFAPFMARSTKQSKHAIKLSWNKVCGAKKYVLYASKCGLKYRPKKIKTISGTKKSITIKKISGKKLKAGKYYKFQLVAFDKNGKKITTSKLIHAATKGGKYCNYKKVKTNALNSKVELGVGSTFKLKGKAIKASKKLKVAVHRKVSFVSSDKDIVRITKKGRLVGISKGTAKVYAYAQNGVYKTVKVTVK